ncbi:MAG: hypothetical protein HN909_06740 [Phycisphaerales bacterium]|jgi:hypothetical protein|nr:hypothetical protein [Phycisphaerales bacterium]MBT7171450.1 hypothetical protein [Phycisphaerales bacterium]
MSSKSNTPAPKPDAKPQILIPGQMIPSRPTKRHTLAAAVKKLLGITVPGRKMCPHHDTPLDYLVASFLQQHDLLVWANRCGGKTMVAAIATLLDAIYRPGSKIRILGGSFEQSARLAEYIREFCHDRPDMLDGTIRRDRVNIVGGSEIRMLAQSQRAVRGQHVQKIRCDEVDLFDSEVWQAVQFATRSEAETRGSIEVLSTLHRSGGLMDQLVQEARERASGDDPAQAGYRLINWCLWEVIERCPPERECASCPLEEDCGGIARDGEGFFRIDDAITIKARSSRSAWEAEMLCKGPQRQYLVFEEFDPALHVREMEYCTSLPLYRAIDFGYASPLTCLWIQVTDDGTVHVLDEYARVRLPLTKHAGNLIARDMGTVNATFVDPAGRQREGTSGAASTELLASMGIPCRWCASRILEGLELIRAALSPAIGAPKLLIHPRCKILINSFQTYHYPAPETTAEPDRPVKDGPDHAIDALRYFFVNCMRPKQKVRRIRY